MPRRKIVHIDEDKCDGCGECIPSCAEGAIRIVNGKARLVADALCDGLGACLGHCPQGAITITEREADEFDERLVHEQKRSACPGGEMLTLAVLSTDSAPTDPTVSAPSAVPVTPRERTDSSSPGLKNWPIQLHLVPPTAPFFRNADVLLVANCVPFAVMDFHERFVGDGVCLTACPKLDDTRGYTEKLAAILSHGGIRSLTILRMSVPCCGGLLRIAQAARQAAGTANPLREISVSSRGDVTADKTA
ncbi:ATP-binding protein [Thermopirellula anaerolimosa]